MLRATLGGAVSHLAAGQRPVMLEYEALYAERTAECVWPAPVKPASFEVESVNFEVESVNKETDR
jgi:hypothetical protein